MYLHNFNQYLTEKVTSIHGLQSIIFSDYSGTVMYKVSKVEICRSIYLSITNFIDSLIPLSKCLAGDACNSFIIYLNDMQVVHLPLDKFLITLVASEDGNTGYMVNFVRHMPTVYLDLLLAAKDSCYV
ncbi:hypothetical protein A3Q56_03446 [Intoshia linei]|uniref:Roadblock/LAMTOR2 domain-containing protein n=1 Tax=Intoshia linei TaxID=1819745 RepID=A0A177B3F3_9BILA|nr:hypothetical protein A3Q56_03446 [Intoshia linei]